MAKRVNRIVRGNKGIRYMNKSKPQKAEKIQPSSTLYASRYTMVFDVNQPGRGEEKILYNPLAGSIHIVNTSTVNYNINILAKEGFVHLARDGKFSKCYLGVRVTDSQAQI